MEKCYKIHGYPGPNKQGGRPKSFRNANNVFTDPEKTEESAAIPSLPGLNQEQSRQLFQFLTNLTANGSNKQEGEEATASATYMAGMSKVLESIHCLCALGKDAWILDNSASDHMCSDQSLLHDLCSLQQPILVNLPNGMQVKVTKHGKLRLTNHLVLDHVLHIPNFKLNLLSIKRLCQQLRCAVHFTEALCLLQGHSQSRPLVIGKSTLGLYILDKEIVQGLDAQAKASQVIVGCLQENSCTDSIMHDYDVVSTAVVQFDTWHNRLGHMSIDKMKLVFQHEKIPINDRTFVCDICPRAKQHRLSFPRSHISTESVFDLLHIDTWGPYHTKTPMGHRYFLTIVDDHSRGTWTHLMVTKDEALGLIKRFVAMAKTQFGRHVKIIRSDNALEFGKSNEALSFFAEAGIKHETTCVHTPQQNGVVERKHKHLLEVSRALMFQSSLPLKYWGECVLTATHLINRMPTKVLGGRTPFEVLFGTAPSYEHLKVFGCLCYMTTIKHGRDKFQDRAKACVFMGYPFGKKGYRVMELETSKFYESRDIIFHEHIFPFASKDETSPQPRQPPHIMADEIDQPANFTEGTPSVNPDSADIAPAPRRSTRQHKLPQHLHDYVCCSTTQGLTDACCCTLTNMSLYPRASYGVSAAANMAPIVEPHNFWEAVTDPGWREAMDKEIQALNANNTWEVVSLPQGKRPIDCKWVYKAKYRADGSLERLKARLVVRGFTQKAGIDFTETFSPVVKLTTVRALMAVAVKKGWKMHQLDVNNAFLHGDLHEEIYMKLPQGITSDLPNAVCRLKKSLYGLKQASRQWYAKLVEVLYARGYKHSPNDYSLFSKQTATSSVFLGVYVDDIIMTGDDELEMQGLKAYLDEVFKIKDLGLVHYFLGIEVLHVKEGLLLTQRKFARELLQEFDCADSRPVSCPLDLGHKLTAEGGDLLADPSVYRRGVGKLNFLTNTRPDLAFAVQHLSQFMQCPRVPHYNAFLHVLRYIKGQPELGILLHGNSDYSLQAYCDSD